jgi:hypothetical protein
MQTLEDGMVLRIVHDYTKTWTDLSVTWCAHSVSGDPITSSHGAFDMRRSSDVQLTYQDYILSD